MFKGIINKKINKGFYYGDLGRVYRFYWQNGRRVTYNVLACELNPFTGARLKAGEYVK